MDRDKKSNSMNNSGKLQGKSSILIAWQRKKKIFKQKQKCKGKAGPDNRMGQGYGQIKDWI